MADKETKDRHYGPGFWLKLTMPARFSDRIRIHGLMYSGAQ